MKTALEGRPKPVSEHAIFDYFEFCDMLEHPTHAGDKSVHPNDPNPESLATPRRSSTLM